MPIRLCNAPVTFQHLMQNTLGEQNLMYCIIYLDDVIVFRHSEEEHLECLHVVFQQFRDFNLKPKPSKCSIFQSEIINLAHYMSYEGINLSRENVHVIEEFPMLETFTQVHAFCGMAGHYWHFIKGFAHIASSEKGGQNGPGAATLRSTGGGEDPEGQDPVCPHVGVPGF